MNNNSQDIYIREINNSKKTKKKIIFFLSIAFSIFIICNIFLMIYSIDLAKSVLSEG